MATLPAELWIMILDIVIEQGIVRLDHCDHSQFPYIQARLPSAKTHHRSYDSYYRLRLVCRSFNAILGPRPTSGLSSSPFPAPNTTRALGVNLHGDDSEVCHRLLADGSRWERLVFLDVTCCLSTSSSRPNLADLLCVGKGLAFPNVQRLGLLLSNNHRSLRREVSFWTRLWHEFPYLVTLSIRLDFGRLCLVEETETMVIFEKLEILYFGGTIIYSGCCFPNLRHVSVETVSGIAELGILERSPQLESLFIREDGANIAIDVGLLLNLRVLGLSEGWLRGVVPIGRKHPLEHLWLTADPIPRFSPSIIRDLLNSLPGLSRITIDMSLSDLEMRALRTNDLRAAKLPRICLDMRPSDYDDAVLLIELGATVLEDAAVKRGIWKRAWRKMRR